MLGSWEVSHVPTHQGPTLVLVYSWYTNIEHDRREKINSFTYTRNLTFYIRNILTSSIKRKNEKMSPMVELYAYCPMNKSFVEAI